MAKMDLRLTTGKRVLHLKTHGHRIYRTRIMTLFVVDTEADGPAPGLFSMVSFGVVEFTSQGPGETYMGEVAPISPKWIPSALAVTGVSREQHLAYPDPKIVMPDFAAWVQRVNKPGSRAVFVSDNPAFDWQFMNYYLWAYNDGNPFGHSARRIGDFYAGLQGDFFARQDWKKLKITKHTHNPLDDAKGNCEALAAIMPSAKSTKTFP